MYGVDHEYEFLSRAWHIIGDIATQLSMNERLALSLRNQTGQLKIEAAELASGFKLRRFNVDLSRESLESELERTSAQLLMENQALSHENKQLSLLLNEFEHALETVLSKFRGHSAAAEVHEYQLMRYYERRLAQEAAITDPLSHPQITQHVERLAHNLQAALASIEGKPVEDPFDESGFQPPSVVPSQPSPEHDPSHAQLTEPPAPNYPPTIYPPVSDSSSKVEPPDNAETSNASSSSEPSHAPTNPPAADVTSAEAVSESKPDPTSDSELEEPELSWAHARELEIARLADENARMRALLGIDDATLAEAGISLPDLPSASDGLRNTRLSGGVLVAASWASPGPATEQQQQQPWVAPPQAQSRLVMPVPGQPQQTEFLNQQQQHQQYQQQYQQQQQQQQLVQAPNGAFGRGGMHVGAGRGGGAGTVRGGWVR